MNENIILEEQFGFVPYYDDIKQEGWLLNYKAVVTEEGFIKAKLYLVDENSKNFLVILPYFPNFLIKTTDLDSAEEYFKKKYLGQIETIDRIERNDTKEYNHLNKLPSTFLNVVFKTKGGFDTVISDLKKILAKNKASIAYNTENFEFDQNQSINAESSFVELYDYDIPIEISIANHFNIRCGKWYGFSYNGEKYTIHQSEKIVFPDLRIFAFDIETSKKPLLFPNAKSDKIMLISIKTEKSSELIVNREIIPKDIDNFEYTPKDDMESYFNVSNETTEEGVLIRFIEIIQKHRPHIITSYNGSSFDFPFIEKRCLIYGIDLNQTIGFYEEDEYYISPFIVHLDSYKWVKRDSYLPVGSHGLKAVTKVKLGYNPDEVDPEEMVPLAQSDPDTMASYSASDAVATYYLYVKYVQPHIFSICSLIPLPPADVLCQGSGTLCEALLISEAINYNIVIPKKRRDAELKYYNGHITENLTYVGGHVECLRTGIFRSDFVYDFNIKEECIMNIIENLDNLLLEYKNEKDYEEAKKHITSQLLKNIGQVKANGNIYHFDVGAMYPNIILTNKLQPISIVDEDTCIRCDFSDEYNNCKRKMNWVLKVDYMPPSKQEVDIIKSILAKEYFPVPNSNTAKEGEFYKNETKVRKIPFSELSLSKQNELIVERVKEYSRSIYKRVKIGESSVQTSTVCQREIPFYVETVRKFRDQRYIYKKLQKDAFKKYEVAGTPEEKIHAEKSLVIFSSLQVAYKCVLNSFYGYVMRKSSRWYSMEMAAIVCNVGGQVIKKAKGLVDDIGMSLELDTDGIWCLVPSTFPSIYTFLSGKKASFLAEMLNFFVCKTFTNHQYQTFSNGEYIKKAENSIFFEADGPYKAMFIPASTEENVLLKKRYAVINDNNKISELKGFEIKRRGELELVKRIQEELFFHFLDGNTLLECYDSLAYVCNYWMDIVKSKGEYLDEETILSLLSESRSMSKDLSEYNNKKSNIRTTANRMSEFLGKGILEEKLKCEYVIAAFPPELTVAERAIPVTIFRSEKRNRYLKLWLKKDYNGDIRSILDWNYYKSRLETIILKLVILPALSQNIKNPIEDIVLPQWALKQRSNLSNFNFEKIKDIEEVINEKNVVSESVITKTEIEKPREVNFQELLENNFVKYMEAKKSSWDNLIDNIIDAENILCIKVMDDKSMGVYGFGSTKHIKKIIREREFYLDVNSWDFFQNDEKISIVERFLPHTNTLKKIAHVRISEEEFVQKRELYQKFFNHFSIIKVYEENIPQIYKNMIKSSPVKIDYRIITTFMKQGEPHYAIGNDTLCFSDKKEFKKRIFKLINQYTVIILNRGDINIDKLKVDFNKYHIFEVNYKVYTSLGSYNQICSERVELHKKISEELNMLIETSLYTKIPFMNINDNVLDIMYYDELKNANTICDEKGVSEICNLIKDDMYKPGYYGNYVIEFECVGSLLLSLIEYKSILGENTMFEGINRKDFLVLRDLIKKIMLDFIKGVKGTLTLMKLLSSWIKKDSKLISEELRSLCNLLRQKYIIRLASKLKEQKYNIIAINKDIIFIETGKNTLEAAQEFSNYLYMKIADITGYEIMKIRTVRIFQKLIYIDPVNYFFQKNDLCYAFSDIKIPVDFLKLYFDFNEFNSEKIFKLITAVSTETAKLMIKMMGFKPDTQVLRSNCFKLLHINEFEKEETIDILLSIICDNCGSENVIRSKCIKCYTPYSRESIFNLGIKYLKELIRLELIGDSFCDKCNSINESKLKDYCKCGGLFKQKRYWNDVQKLRKLINNIAFDEICKNVSGHFK